MATHLLAPAKLTTRLAITGVRSDGFHEIDAEMVTIDLADELTVSRGDGLTVDALATGLQVVTDESNSVRRALALVGRTAQVHLHKRIPAGAGLGGGSADAAAILRWAGFDDLEAAATLGADVPFCVRGGWAHVTGIGDQLVPLAWREATFTLCIPPFGCSTPAVYKAWDALGGPHADNGNDLEPAALFVEPRLAQWRDELAEATGQRPRMAGSGSTWFVAGAYPGPGRVVANATVPRSTETPPSEELL